MEERLQNVLSHAGVASRRAAAEIIAAGRVTVDGLIVREPGARVDASTAKIAVECAKIQAKITETRGEAEVKAKFVVENEEALGLKRRASAFKDPSLWADLTFADALNPDVRIRVIHAGEGTLWTDLKGASIAVPAQGKK